MAAGEPSGRPLTSPSGVIRLDDCRALVLAQAGGLLGGILEEVGKKRPTDYTPHW